MTLPPDWQDLSQEEWNEMLNNLRCIINPGGIGLWWHVPIPKLGHRTAAQAVEDGDARAVLEVTRGYLGRSYV